MKSGVKILVGFSIGYVVYRLAINNNAVVGNSSSATANKPYTKPITITPPNSLVDVSTIPIFEENGIPTPKLTKKQQLTTWAAKRYADLAARTAIIKIIILKLNNLEVDTFYEWAIVSGENKNLLDPSTLSKWEVLTLKHNLG